MYPLGRSTVYVAPDVNPTNVIKLADVYFVKPPIVTPPTVPLARPLSVNVADPLDEPLVAEPVPPLEIGGPGTACTP